MMQPQWREGTQDSRGFGRRKGWQVLQAVLPEVHSLGEQRPQGPDPPAFPYSL